MRLIRGGFQVVRSPEKRMQIVYDEETCRQIVAPTSADVNSYMRRVGALAELMSDAHFRWHLEGGLLVPLRIGKFFRRHGDIDIGLYLQEIGISQGFFRDKGYDFFYRNPGCFRCFEALPWDIFEQAENDGDAIAKRTSDRLYLRKLDKSGEIDRIEETLPEIGVHMHVRKGPDVINQGYGLPSEWFYNSVSLKTRGLPEIPLGSMREFYFFTLNPSDKLWALIDRIAIERAGLLTGREIREVQRVREKQ